MNDGLNVSLTSLARSNGENGTIIEAYNDLISICNPIDPLPTQPDNSKGVDPLRNWCVGRI